MSEKREGREKMRKNVFILNILKIVLKRKTDKMKKNFNLLAF